MKNKIPDEIMAARRIERLIHVKVFMESEYSALNSMALGATHNLLTGWFENSHWRTAWYCVKKALSNSWMRLSLRCQLFYWEKIRRLSEDEVEVRMFGVEVKDEQR